jgi:hypothetical protein
MPPATPLVDRARRGAGRTGADRHAAGLGRGPCVVLQWRDLHECRGTGSLNATNSEHEPISPIAELIDRHFDWSLPAEHWSAHYRATEIVIAVGIDKPNRRG